MKLEDAIRSAIDPATFGDYTAPLNGPNIALVASPDDPQIIPTIQEAISRQYPSARVLVTAMPAKPGYRLRQLQVALYQGVRGQAPSRSEPVDENTLPFMIRAEFDCLIVDGAERLDKAGLHYLSQDSNMPPSILVGRHHRLLTRISGDPPLKARMILMKESSPIDSTGSS